MELISRKIINSNLVVQSLNDNTGEISTHSYQEIIQYINQAKTYLIKEKKCKEGQKVLLAMSGWPQYLVWFIACAELGMSFVVSDYPNIENYKSVAKKLNLYGGINHLIGRPKSEVLKHYPSIINRLINSNVIYGYRDQAHADTFWAKSSSIILYATSSGTTDTPKVISYTQKFFYDLLERNARLYNLKDEDRCLHTKGLHHGSVTGVYFLPTLKYCSNHYYAKSYDSITKDQTLKSPNWVELIQKEKINRCLLFYNMVDHFVQNADLESKQHNDLTVYVLAKISKEHINVIVKKFNYKIASIFGCTETSGPLFLPEITVENSEEYNPANFGNPLDDFYKINLDNNQILTVTMPDGSIISTGDKFQIVNNDYIFYGRENLCRINGLTVYLNTLIEVIEQILDIKHTEEFDIVFDKEFEKIYIRLDFDVDLDDLNRKIVSAINQKHYVISDKVIVPRGKLFTGIKFDPEEIRIRCRKID
jgi:acyl-CoA synthetase (AMP-forming)/AMP-acid ligase II